MKNNIFHEEEINLDIMQAKINSKVKDSEIVLKKLNRIAFIVMGDMNWHAHCGIFTTPIQLAVKFKIPLIIRN